MNRRARLVAVFVCSVAPACSARFAQTAERVTDGQAVGSPNPCSSDSSMPLSVTHFDVAENIRYERPGYNGVPQDEHIAFSVDSSGAAKVAWLDESATHVHVTSLDASLEPTGTDVVVDGIDIGGFVAQTDGFALLTRRQDPGEPLPDPANNGEIGDAAFFVRVRQGVEEEDYPLTGTASITTGALGAARDCATSPLNGRLEWNGDRYGAYFVVHGCEGDTHASYYGDKLTYLDDGGRSLSGGWSWNCSINEGIRLVPESGVFTSLCISDGTPYPGVDLVVGGEQPVELAPEASAPGYSGGQFGSVVKMGDGSYFVGWLSHGVRQGSPSQNGLRAPGVAFIRLGSDRTPVGEAAWLLQTSDAAQANLHFAPYGPNRLLMMWDSVQNLQCGPQTCLGTYAGTHGRLLDENGNFLTRDTPMSAVPNGDEDIAVFPNGDLGWAFVDDPDRSYSSPIVSNDAGIPEVTPRHTLSIARIAYCP